MEKLRLGTCWLDGCSGCHMSLLDVDEGLVAVLKKADIVFGPLVDAQEWPEGVDVAVIEGAVSSQDDLKLAQTARARSKVVVALGDCAVTSNVPSMRNGIPVRKLLERVYVEGVDAKPGVPRFRPILARWRIRGETSRRGRRDGFDRGPGCPWRLGNAGSSCAVTTPIFD